MSWSAEHSQKASKAEELFYLLKNLAGTNKVLDMEVVRATLCHTASAQSALYVGLKKLEEKGTIQLVMDTTYGRGRIAQVKLLQDEVSIPQGKRGRKPAQPAVAKNNEPVNPSPVRIFPCKLITPSIPPTPIAVVHPVTIDNKNRQSGAVVLIDENQIIASERDRNGLDPCAILEKIRQCLGVKVERVYFYYSEATEKQNRSAVANLVWLEHPLIRTVKTGSQPGAVDRRIKEDVSLWLRVDFVSTIVLGTADGGPDFLAAIEQIKSAGKKFVLLKLGGCFNSALRQSANALIDASALGARRRPFADIVAAAKKGDINREDQNTRLLLAIVRGVTEFFQTKNEGVNFGEIIEHTRSVIRGRREFDVFSYQDMREGLTALVQVGHLLLCKKERSGRHVYQLAYSNVLPWLKKIPASTLV